MCAKTGGKVNKNTSGHAHQSPDVSSAKRSKRSLGLVAIRVGSPSSLRWKASVQVASGGPAGGLDLRRWRHCTRVCSVWTCKPTAVQRIQLHQTFCPLHQASWRRSCHTFNPSFKSQANEKSLAPGDFEGRQFCAQQLACSGQIGPIQGLRPQDAPGPRPALAACRQDRACRRRRTAEWP